MNADTFRQLMARTEDATLDFKQEMYSFDGDGRVDLLKDIISMANTPRSFPAYLVFGVEWKPGLPAVAKGMLAQIDDAKLRDQISSELISPVPPNLFYHALLQDGKHFGVIELPPEQTVGPFYATKDWGNKLLRDVLYVRSGSVNSRANREQQRSAYKWFGRVVTASGQLTT